MALWKINSGSDEEIVYSNGALQIKNPPSTVSVTRHFYTVPYSNTVKGGFLKKDGKKFHVPSWIEVHPQATLDDIMIKKNPFEEIFIERKDWTFKSESSDKEYTVREGKNGLHCDCWGYIAHRKCKHIKQIQSQL